MMKSIELLFSILTLVLIASYGCSVDNPANPDPGMDAPTAEAFNALHDAAINSRTQTAQFNVEDGITFTSENGAELSIPAGCLERNGNAVTGAVTLEYVEMFNKSDMVVTDKPTMGLTPGGGKKLLTSGGEFSINTVQNGSNLKLSCNANLNVPANLTGGLDYYMTVWKGQTDPNGNFVWKDKEIPTADNNVDTLFTFNDKYHILFDQFGWTNVDRFHSDPRPKTTLQVRPPQGYDDTNCTFFLSYDGEPNALAHLDSYDQATGLFSEHYGQVPLGLDMHIIFVTEDNGQWRYAIKGVTVADNDLYSFSFEETQVVSEQDLTDAVKVLP